MFAYSHPSYNYPTVPRHGYGYYPPSFSQSNQYFDALAEARAAEQELRAQAAARREENFRAELAARQEEEILRRRLQGLQQSRLPQYSSYPFEPYYDTPSLRPSDGRLESLRLQVEEEERQLAKLEALRQRRLELEQEERGRREIEERLAHWGRPATPKVPETATNVYSRPSARQGCPVYPETNFLSYGKSAQSSQPRLFVQPPSEKPKYVRFTIDQDGLPRQSQPAARKEEQPSTSSQAVGLGDFLQQLGLSVPTVGSGPQAPKAPQQPEVPKLPKVSNVQPPKAPEKPSPPRESTTTQTSSFPVLDFGQFLNLLTNAGQGPQQEQKKQVPRPKSPQTTLKEDLEKRLNNEHANEVRDTIQAILESLNPRPVPTSTRQQSAATPSTSAPKSSDKGKTKDAPATTVPGSPSPKDYTSATERVQAIENRFHVLESEFVFPPKLDFVPISSTNNNNSSSGPATSHLAYTANNQAVRFYQQSLTYLLTQLDLIESFGNEELRHKRKEVVQKVEHALEDLEQEIEGRWNAKVARESKRRSVTVEDVTLEEEEVGTPKSTATTHILEEEPRPEAPTTSVSPTPVPLTPAVAPLDNNTEEATAPLLSERPEDGVVTEEPIIIESSEATPTPTPSQENFTSEETKESVVVAEVVETVEETQTQSSTPFESESAEQLPVEESRIVTPLGSAESTADPAASSPPTPFVPATSLDSTEGDLSATIRPSSPIIDDDDVRQDSNYTESLVSEKNTEESESDTNGDDAGFLLQGGEGEEESPRRDLSDVESNASDWSEV